MDRDVKEYLKWLGVAALLIIVGNMLSGCRTKLVFVPEPYVSVLPLDEGDTVLGRTKCDMAGKPVMYISAKLDSVETHWVTLHEVAHVEQIILFGGCLKFMDRYEHDPMFKLKVEAEAFCLVHEAQAREGLKPDPTNGAILIVLMSKYDAQWSVQQAKDVMKCSPDGTYVHPP